MSSVKAAIVRVKTKPQPKFVFDHLSRRREIQIFDGMLFGRSAGAEKFPHDELMSGKHLLIHVQEGKTFIEDLDSTNGTKLNDRLILPRQLIQVSHGDIIKIGKQKFRCRDTLIRDRVKFRFESYPIIKETIQRVGTWTFYLFIVLMFVLFYSNRHYPIDKKYVENSDEKELLDRLGTSIRANTAGEVCLKVGQNEKLPCLRKIGAEIESKGVGLTYFMSFYDQNTRILNQELSNPNLSTPQKIAFRLYWLESTLHILDLLLQRKRTHLISFSVPDHLFAIHSANAILVILPHLDRLAIHTFQSGSEIEPSFTDYEREHFNDLRAEYTSMKARLLEASELDRFDNFISYFVKPQTFEIDTTFRAD